MVKRLINEQSDPPGPKSDGIRPWLLRAAVVLSVLVLAPAVLSPPALAQADCDSFARTEFEQLYCKLNAQSPGSVPGSLQEFRNNPPATQRLLLRRPAERLGLQLPAMPATGPARPAQAAPEKAAKTTPEPPEREPALARQSPHLGDCRLQGAAIHCKTQVYTLLSNVNNSRLATDALADSNRLILGDAPAPDAVEDWLQDSYVRYLDAMIAIGLAGETLSYTKFHHLYQEADAAGLSFAQRMADMYEYLKKDKQTLAVRAGHADGLPEALTDCYPINSRYVVCDNVRVNWIYRQR